MEKELDYTEVSFSQAATETLNLLEETNKIGECQMLENVRFYLLVTSILHLP